MISRQVNRLALALKDFDPAAPRLQAWGSTAARVLTTGGRLLACAGDESRELALYLAAELRASPGAGRPSLDAAAIVRAGEAPDSEAPDHEASAPERSLAEQARSQGRPGDILVCLSAAEPSDDIVAAARAAAAGGLTTWALTGPAADALAGTSCDVVAVAGEDARVVEEVHLVAIHVFYAAVDSCVRDRTRRRNLPPSAGQAA
jgi:D-sedoheptulose 7-phosphate isomerase